jgi:hypothetical protein
VFFGLAAALACGVAAILLLWVSSNALRRQQAKRDDASLVEYDDFLRRLASLASRGQELFERASVSSLADTPLLAEIETFESEIEQAEANAVGHAPDHLLAMSQLSPQQLFRELREATLATRQFHAAENRQVDGELFHAQARRASALLAQLKFDLETADAAIRRRQDPGFRGAREVPSIH